MSVISLAGGAMASSLQGLERADGDLRTAASTVLHSTVEQLNGENSYVRATEESNDTRGVDTGSGGNNAMYVGQDGDTVSISDLAREGDSQPVLEEGLMDAMTAEYQYMGNSKVIRTSQAQFDSLLDVMVTGS